VQCGMDSSDSVEALVNMAINFQVKKEAQQV
jgi:hypothetical protein